MAGINRGGSFAIQAGDKTIEVRGAAGSNTQVSVTKDGGVQIKLNNDNSSADSLLKSDNYGVPNQSSFNNSGHPLLANSGNVSSTAPSTGSSPEKQIFQFFTSKGYPPHQAAAIVGNLKVESNFDLNTVGDGGEAKGIAQWHPDRQQKMKEVIGKDVSEASLEEQLTFIDWELNNTEKEAGDKFKATKDVATAASVFDELYERSSGEHRDKRIAEAQKVSSSMV